MNINEDTLDQLYALQVKRAAEILETGKDFRLANSDHQFKGILDATQNTIKFQSDAPARYGAIFECKGARFYVVSAEAKAGMLVADVKPITATVEVLRKDSIASAVPGKGPSTRLVPEQSQLPVFGVKGNEITAPKHAAVLNGRIIKHGGTFYEVVHTAISGPFAVLSVKTYIPTPPTAPSRKTEAPAWTKSTAPAVRTFGGY